MAGGCAHSWQMVSQRGRECRWSCSASDCGASRTTYDGSWLDEQLAATDRWIAREAEIDAEFAHHADGTPLAVIRVGLLLASACDTGNSRDVERLVQIEQAVEMRLKRDHGLVTENRYGLPG